MGLQPQQSLTLLSRFMVLVGIFLLSQSIFSFLGIAIASRLYHLSYTEVVNLVSSPELSAAGIGAQRFVQAFYNLGAFFVTAIVFSGFYRKPLPASLGFEKPAQAQMLPLALMLAMVALPFISMLAHWNNLLPGLEQLGDISAMQEKRNKLLEVLLHSRGTGDTILLIFLVAAIPALSEEVFFRGLLQRYLGDWTGRPVAGVWISAVLFTLLHFSVTQFMPIFFMGVLFGYLYLWTRNIWVCITAHFVNNSLTVLFHGFTKRWPDAAVFQHEYTPPVWIGLLSAAALGVVMYRFYAWRRNNPHSEPLWP